MKTYLIIAFAFISIGLNAQTGKVLSIIGGAGVIASTAYYIAAEPSQPLEWNVTTGTMYQNDYRRYQRNRVAFLAGSSAVLVSGLLLNIAEVKTSEKTSLNINPNGIQFTLRW